MQLNKPPVRQNPALIRPNPTPPPKPFTSIKPESSDTTINSLDDCVQFFLNKIQMPPSLFDALKASRYSTHNFDDIDKLDLLSYLCQANSINELTVLLTNHPTPRRTFKTQK